MKKGYFLCFSILLIICFCLLSEVPALAASHRDEMDAITPNESRIYANLKVIEQEKRNIPDKTRLSFDTSASVTGSVTYRLQNCEKITVGMYD